LEAEINRPVEPVVGMSFTRALFPILGLAVAAFVASTDAAFAGVVAVPEPGTLTLLVGSAAGVLILRHKLRK
jgi:hypothetical protein